MQGEQTRAVKAQSRDIEVEALACKSRGNCLSSL